LPRNDFSGTEIFVGKEGGRILENSALDVDDPGENFSDPVEERIVDHEDGFIRFVGPDPFFKSFGVKGSPEFRILAFTSENIHKLRVEPSSGPVYNFSESAFFSSQEEKDVNDLGE